VSLVVEALLISAFTGTPGKALMGVSVRKAAGGKLSTPKAALRWLMVLVMGRGAGVPIISLMTLVNAYQDVEKTGSTSWDDMLDVRVARKPVGWWRWTLAVLIFASLVGLSALGTLGEFKNL
jgi:hypothetical protein